MPTPDSIDRPQPKAPPAPRRPGATPWETLFGAGDGPITVYINPVTRQAVRVMAPSQVPALVAQGYLPATVAPENWATFVQGLGSNFRVLGPQEDPAVVAPTTQQPLSPAEQAALAANQGYIDAQAGAGQSNLTSGYNISQAGRDRAAVITKENYKATEQPTLASAAFSGAGYHQGLGDLLKGRVQRDRALAGLADEQTSAQFQYDLASQQLEQQRRQATQQLYQDMVQRSQSAYNSGIDSILGWVLK